MQKEFITKKGNKITISIEKTTLKEKIYFITSVAVVVGLIWWFNK